VNKKWTISLVGVFFVVLIGVSVLVWLRRHEISHRMGAIPTPPEIAERYLWCGKHIVLIQPSPPFFIKREGEFAILNLTSDDVSVEIKSFCPQSEISDTNFILKGEESKNIFLKKKDELKSCVVRLIAEQENCKDIVDISVKGE